MKKRRYIGWGMGDPLQQEFKGREKEIELCVLMMWVVRGLERAVRNSR